MQSFYPARRKSAPEQTVPSRNELDVEASSSALFQGAGASTEDSQALGSDSAVWRAVCLIPAGRVSTYGDLARALGGSWTPQSVGQALKRNPYAPAVPCHRIVRADRSLGGYFGATSTDDPRVQAKVRLLEEEGVIFDQPSTAGQLLVERTSVWHFPREPALKAVRLPGEASGEALQRQAVESLLKPSVGAVSGVSLYPSS
ncbi:unnamed protein product [Polarella glacialis]|uniref:Methylated-DNA--protein-cysteine methyltransferase n=1 Tax=Polarella glacialis TaxID=89957 RepID=A0A813GW75_POLGL|nr:unnamed protein product [Polarella glacialis]